MGGANHLWPVWAEPWATILAAAAEFPCANHYSCGISEKETRACCLPVSNVKLLVWWSATWRSHNCSQPLCIGYCRSCSCFRDLGDATYSHWGRSPWVHPKGLWTARDPLACNNWLRPFLYLSVSLYKIWIFGEVSIGILETSLISGDQSTLRTP